MSDIRSFFQKLKIKNFTDLKSPQKKSALFINKNLRFLNNSLKSSSEFPTNFSSKSPSSPSSFSSFSASSEKLKLQVKDHSGKTFVSEGQQTCLRGGKGGEIKGNDGEKKELESLDMCEKSGSFGEKGGEVEGSGRKMEVGKLIKKLRVINPKLPPTSQNTTKNTSIFAKSSAKFTTKKIKNPLQNSQNLRKILWKNVKKFREDRSRSNYISGLLVGSNNTSKAGSIRLVDKHNKVGELPRILTPTNSENKSGGFAYTISSIDGDTIDMNQCTDMNEKVRKVLKMRKNNLINDNTLSPKSIKTSSKLIKNLSSSNLLLSSFQLFRPSPKYSEENHLRNKKLSSFKDFLLNYNLKRREIDSFVK